MKRMQAGCLVLAWVLALTSVLPAQTAEALRDRMRDRMVRIAALKQSKAIGENRDGYLTVLREAELAKEDAQTVAEENVDRRQVYAAIAARTGIGVEQVGQQRAQQIAAAAKPGMMIQNAAGAWVEVK